MTTMEKRDPLLTVDEVADWLRIPKTWIYQRIHAKTLPFPMLKIGKYNRFPEAGIIAYLRESGGAEAVGK